MSTRERSRVRTHLTLRVSFDLPLGATMQDARQYVKDAILGYGEQKGSDYEKGFRLEPMQKLDPASVQVSYHSKEVTY